jgi:hypothetical protein
MRAIGQESDKLLGLEDRAEFDVAVFFDDLKPLARFEAEHSPNFLGDDDLILWGQK